LKTGKGFNLEEKPIIIHETTATTTITTPTAQVKPVESSSQPTPTIASTASPQIQSQTITLTPKLPPPVGQPLVPIAQPMPSQWQPNLVSSA
jgi:hypothetical protein